MQEEWIIGFFDIDRPRMVFSPFLKPGFRHAMALRYDVDKKVWLCLNWGKRGLTVKALDHNEVDRVIAFVHKHNGTFLAAKAQKSVYRFPVLPCWCVTAIRHLLGIKKTYFTPYQLYCALLKSGATPMFTSNV
jgi:hypothetical protein